MTKDWNEVEETVRELYTQGNSLIKVMQEVENKYGFKASTRSFRAKVNKWGLKRCEQHQSSLGKPSAINPRPTSTRVESPARDPEQQAREAEQLRLGMIVTRLQQLYKKIIEERERIQFACDGLPDAEVLAEEAEKAESEALRLEEEVRIAREKAESAKAAYEAREVQQTRFDAAAKELERKELEHEEMRKMLCIGG